MVTYATNTGSPATLALWAATPTWTNFVPGVNKCTVSSTTLSFPNQYTTTAIASTGVLTTATGDGSTYYLVRISWVPYSSIL
jgi:hypothetical protein